MESLKEYPESDSIDFREIEAIVFEGGRLDASHGLTLLNHADLNYLGLLADSIRRRKHPEMAVTYVIDRNINYSNICVTRCRFCAFFRSADHNEAYLLTHEDIGSKIDEAKSLGATSILLQGGQHPDLKIDYYEDLFRYIKKNHPIHLHALSPSEIRHIAAGSQISLKIALERLHRSGLDSIPGGGAEILTEKIRKQISPEKGSVDDWLEVMETAHGLGLRTSATMMFGHIETSEDRIEHLVRLRNLQDITGGFTAFIPWTFQPGNTALHGNVKGYHNLGLADYLRTLAVSRLMLDNIDNVQASWVTQGAKGAQVALAFGANDFGSTMIEENVVKSAGVSFRMSESGIVRMIRDAGYRPLRRNILYDYFEEPSTDI